MASNDSPIFLDVDSTIVEDNLRFVENANEEFNKIFKQPGEMNAGKLIKPYPGFCIKTKEVGSNNKFFINICQINDIPAPKDVSEQELADILESDEPSTFRVPMSIGEVRTETDKKGEEARVCDVVVNTDFFKKIERIQLFKNFFITIVFEGLKDKYGIICHDDKIILKNRKAFGTLQMHRIQQRNIDNNTKADNKLLIEEIKSKNLPVSTNLCNQNYVEGEQRVPDYRLFRRKDQPNWLIGEFRFPDIISAEELSLNVGEDRILIGSSNNNYFLDIFIPHIIRQTSCLSTFNKSTKVLRVKMSLLGG